MKLKGPSLCLAFAFLVGSTNSALGEVTAEKIAIHCAMDSNGTVDQYMDYGVKLAKTLQRFSPAALHRILGEYHASANDQPNLNDGLDLKEINFVYGSPKLSASAYEELDKVAEFLIANPDVKIEIEGHTSRSTNNTQALSENRAVAAQLYLAQNGIDPSRVETIGYNNSKPIASGENNPENRRIEIIVKN